MLRTGQHRAGGIRVEVKSDKKIQARHLKGLKTFLQKEKIGILVGRFEEADIIEEGNTRIFLVPHWMV